MRALVLLIFVLSAITGIAQTGIGTTTPNPSAKLDVYSTNKGFLPPRVTLQSATDATTIASPAEGLLVYNLGSVGLQAGYYYWNGANWATIATATSAGNGVTASELVKLYQETYSTTAGKASSSSGYSFTVPVSGRYEFNFNCTGWNSNGSSVKLTFNVREGTTVLGTDYHQSTSSNAWVEYEGRVEVNLTAGVTYNAQVVTTTGSRLAGYDWDKIMYKMVAGNLPVTGQTVDYVSTLLTSNQTNLVAGQVIKFQTIKAGNIPYNATTGYFTLTAGKTYRLTGFASLDGTGSTAGAIDIVWRDQNGNDISNLGSFMSPSYTSTFAGQGVVTSIYTPTSNMSVYLCVSYTSQTSNIVRAYATSALIEQIGSSAIINPWTLSGTNTYNTTGNVGIGNNSPTSTLDVTGTLAVSGTTNLKGNVNVGTGVGSEGGEIDLATAASGNTTLAGNTVAVDVYGDKLRIFENGGNARGVFVDLSKAPSSVAGELIWKASGKVNAGSFVQLDNVKVGPTRSGAGGGYAGLSIGAVSNTYVADVSAVYSNSTVGGQTITGTSYTTTASNSWNGWGFLPGQQSTYILNDTTNNRVYRIILMIGDSSYNNNFVSIERLY